MINIKHSYWYLPPNFIPGKFHSLESYIDKAEELQLCDQLEDKIVIDKFFKTFHIVNTEAVITLFCQLFTKYSSIALTNEMKKAFKAIIEGEEGDLNDGLEVKNVDGIEILLCRFYHTGDVFLQDMCEENDDIRNEFYDVIVKHRAEFQALLDHVRFSDSKAKLRCLIVTEIESPKQWMWATYLLPTDLTMFEFNKIRNFFSGSNMIVY